MKEWTGCSLSNHWEVLVSVHPSCVWTCFPFDRYLQFHLRDKIKKAWATGFFKKNKPYWHGDFHKQFCKRRVLLSRAEDLCIHPNSWSLIFLTGVYQFLLSAKWDHRESLLLLRSCPRDSTTLWSFRRYVWVDFDSVLDYKSENIKGTVYCNYQFKVWTWKRAGGL